MKECEWSVRSKKWSVEQLLAPLMVVVPSTIMLTFPSTNLFVWNQLIKQFQIFVYCLFSIQVYSLLCSFFHSRCSNSLSSEGSSLRFCWACGAIDHFDLWNSMMSCWHRSKCRRELMSTTQWNSFSCLSSWAVLCRVQPGFTLSKWPFRWAPLVYHCRRRSSGGCIYLETFLFCCSKRVGCQLRRTLQLDPAVGLPLCAEMHRNVLSVCRHWVNLCGVADSCEMISPDASCCSGLLFWSACLLKASDTDIGCVYSVHRQTVSRHNSRWRGHLAGSGLHTKHLIRRWKHPHPFQPDLRLSVSSPRPLVSPSATELPRPTSVTQPLFCRPPSSLKCRQLFFFPACCLLPCALFYVKLALIY